MRIRFLACAVLLALPPVTPARAQSPREAVLTTAQAVFDAMAARDTVALGRLLHPAAHLIATVEQGDSVRVNAIDRAAFLRQVAASPTVLLERMWNAEVRISGAIAAIWTSYDFHRDRQFSHCGVDAFHLVRTTAGWQVSSIIYTIVAPPAPCRPSPLGPPR